MKGIVKYHNDFNKVKLPSFTEQEQNILMGIISKIKDNPNETIEFTAQEILGFSTKNFTKKSLNDILAILKTKFFKADFTILQKKVLKIKNENKNVIAQTTINLFRKFTIYLEKTDNTDNPDTIFHKLELEVNPEFAYLIDELSANFTRFELAEFIALSGKYTKTLYRLLKQYRQTGWVEFEFNEFKRILDISDDYAMCNIDQRIIDPAIKELTAERNLFDAKRIIFKNLTYTKIKKGGNRVVAIRFQWDKEQVQEELEAQAEARIAENVKNHIPTSADYNAKQEFENYKGVEIFFYDSRQKIINATIKEFEFEPKRLLCYDKRAQQNFYIPFENLQKANTWIAEKIQNLF